MKYALEIEGLRKKYGEFMLHDVDLRVPTGSIVGLIGENGAGKSTTMKAALDLLQKEKGCIWFFGKELKDFTLEEREKIGVVFDSLNFSETLTPEQIGKICRKIYHKWEQSEYEKRLAAFHLPKDKVLKTFSKGMKAKFSLAVALSHRAELLLLDEPTSGLDPVMRDEILDIFLEYVQDENHSILVSSHITSDLEKIADYIVFLHEGEVMLHEAKDELLYQYGVIRCRKDELMQIQSEDIVAYRFMDYQCNVLVRDRRRAMQRYKNMMIDPVSIDEIMLFYVKGERR